MKRRTCLGLCAGVLSSGCLGQTDQPTTNIDWIHLRNNRDQARDVTVVIERNDREVFRETYQLGTSGEQSTRRIDSPVNGAGHYTIYFDIGDQVVHLHPPEYADVTEPCIGIQYAFHEQETTGFELKPIGEC
jgi:hypothetical protein